MKVKKVFYITTPIFYPNARLHMGHAYTTTISDILARYRRLMGEDVYFLTGSDENTQKMVDAARKEGKDPLQFLDEIVDKFSSLFRELGISYDQFIRTTDQEKHWPGAQLIWKKLKEAGDIYEKDYEGLYCTGHEAFLTEKDLVNGKCPDHETAPELLKEKNLFFNLQKYSSIIKTKIVSGELEIIPESRKNEIISFIEAGLEDVSFSRPRRKDWPRSLGIPVPGDDSQIMYVWCDALTNYITALGYGRDDELFKKFWPGMHVIGKDILRFHAAIWPGMLLSARLPLPKRILVHGFITSGGKKMSKSIGNVIDPEELIHEYGEYGPDAVRYYLARHVSPFEDGDLTREAFREVYNGELANGLGNLVSRIMQLAETHLEKDVNINWKSNFWEQDVGVFRDYHETLKNFEINKAIAFVFSKIQELDRRINSEAPFQIIKTNQAAGKQLILALTRELFRVASMLEPFMPKTSKEIMDSILKNKKPENIFPRKE